MDPNIKFENGIEYRRIRFLQARATWKHPIGQAISIYTALFNLGTPPHCHSEICFSNNVCFSSANRSADKKFKRLKLFTLQDRRIGTRLISYDVLTRNKERWDIYELWVTMEKEGMVWHRAIDILYKPYDWLGIIGFFSPKNIQDKNKWYCSEAVYYVYNNKNIRISPRRLTRWIKRIGGKLISRKGRLRNEK